MKKEDLPQDSSALEKFTREVCYVLDENGNYVTDLSSGWEVKTTALAATWKDIDDRILDVQNKVLNQEASPILFFMEWRLMDLEILSAYTGFWKWRIKRHLKPAIFNKLSNQILSNYAKAFNVSVEALKTMKVND